jgi:hypothetical protein
MEGFYRTLHKLDGQKADAVFEGPGTLKTFTMVARLGPEASVACAWRL